MQFPQISSTANYEILYNLTQTNAPTKDQIHKIFEGALHTKIDAAAIPELIKRSLTQLQADLTTSGKTDMAAQMIKGAYQAIHYLEKAPLKTKTEKDALEIKIRQFDVTVAQLDGKRNFVQIKPDILNVLGLHGYEANSEKGILLDHALDLFLTNNKKGLESLRNFLNLSQVVKEKNLEILSKNDGNIGTDDDEDVVKMVMSSLSLLSEIDQFEFVTDFYSLIDKQSENLEEEDVNPRNILRSLMDTILEGAHLQNIQLFTDGLVSVLPKQDRPKNVVDRGTDRYYVLEERHQKGLQAAQAIEGNPTKKAKVLEDLEFQKHYEVRNFIFDMEGWKNVKNEKDVPFVSGDRVIGFMSADKLKKSESIFPLNLSKVGMKDANQCSQAFELIYKCVNSGLKDSEMLRKWFQMKRDPAPSLEQVKAIIDRNSDLYEVVEKIGKNKELFSNEQLQVLVGIALDYSYKVIHDMRLARLQLSNLV